MFTFTQAKEVLAKYHKGEAPSNDRIHELRDLVGEALTQNKMKVLTIMMGSAGLLLSLFVYFILAMVVEYNTKDTGLSIPLFQGLAPDRHPWLLTFILFSDVLLVVGVVIDHLKEKS